MQNEKAVIVVTAIMLAILVAAGVIFAGYYSDWFKSKFSTFYLTEGKTRLFSDVEGKALANVRFGVTYDFAKDKAYTVKVLPTGEDFAFSVDGVWLNFLALDELTSGFDIALSEKSFSIRCRRVTMRQVLERLFPGSVIAFAGDVDSSAHYKLMVASADGKHAVSLTFRCADSVGVTDFEVDPPNIFA